MRISTPLTKERIKHHLAYSSWKYLLVVVGVIMGWSLIYTTTAYRSPQNKRIDVYVQSVTTTPEIMDAFMKPVWEKAVPDMEVVQSYTLMTTDDYTTTMQLTTYIYAGEGDIYFLTDQYFKSMASTGALLPLEDLLADGRLEMDGIDLKKGYVTVVDAYDDKEKPISTSQHGFMSGMQVDNRGLYAAIVVNNQNDENVIPFFNALLQAGKGEKENWINE